MIEGFGPGRGHTPERLVKLDGTEQGVGGYGTHRHDGLTLYMFQAKATIKVVPVP